VWFLVEELLSGVFSRVCFWLVVKVFNWFVSFFLQQEKCLYFTIEKTKSKG